MSEHPEPAHANRTERLSAQAERVLGRAARRARSNDASSQALIGCGLAVLALVEARGSGERRTTEEVEQ